MIRNRLPKNIPKRTTELTQDEKGIVVNDAERGYLAASAINLVFGIILTLLALRFVFRLLGANPLNAFASLVYNLSQPLLAPFFGLFNYQVTLETARFEVATLIAILVYGVIAGILARIFYADRYHA